MQIIAVVMIGASAIAGCSVPPGPGGTEVTMLPEMPEVADVRVAGYDCGFTWNQNKLTWTIDSNPGRVPDDFKPVEAIWCKTPDVPADGGMPEFTVTELRSDNLEPLVARFRTPNDEADPADYECAPTHILNHIPARVWLVDASGKAILGHSPLGVCGPSRVGMNEAFPDA